MRPRIKVTQWSQWSGPETSPREAARFKATFDRTIRMLEYELERIDVTDAEVALGLDGRFFRRDGWPMTKSDGHPGVVVTYTHPGKGVVRVATDRFYEWTDNLRGIAMTLEALRMMERYGTTGNGRQYEGFRALPASTEATMDVHEAAVIIQANSQLKYPPERLLEVRELAELGVRAALFKAHPDQNLDKPKLSVEENFHRVERARKALSAHHGGGL